MDLEIYISTCAMCKAWTLPIGLCKHRAPNQPFYWIIFFVYRIIIQSYFAITINLPLFRPRTICASVLCLQGDFADVYGATRSLHRRDRSQIAFYFHCHRIRGGMAARLRALWQHPAGLKTGKFP